VVARRVAHDASTDYSVLVQLLCVIPSLATPPHQTVISPNEIDLRQIDNDNQNHSYSKDESPEHVQGVFEGGGQVGTAASGGFPLAGTGWGDHSDKAWCRTSLTDSFFLSQRGRMVAL
jgi:hypothetical protein